MYNWYLCNQELDHIPHTFLNQLIYLGMELFLKKKKNKKKNNGSIFDKSIHLMSF